MKGIVAPPRNAMNKIPGAAAREETEAVAVIVNRISLLLYV